MSGSPEDTAYPGGGEVFGPYRIGAPLGRGGMGEVHRAYDTRRDRWVALKRLAADLADDPEIRERFELECRVAARLASPHVVPIHDFGVIDGRLFLDMRLVDGRDLTRLLAEEGPLDPARAVALVTQLASALDAAHADGLVHRDVKPGNALITTDRGRDFVHLVDFGIVRLAQGGGGRRLTETGSTLGTLAYMAPEQFEGTTVDRRADIYALAVVLFEVLTGRTPFSGGPPQMIHQHLSTPPAPPSTVRPGLPPALDAVVLRGLGKAPADRFATAGELADAAGVAVGRGPDPAAPPVAAQGPSERDRETMVPPVRLPAPPPSGPAGSGPPGPPPPVPPPPGPPPRVPDGPEPVVGAPWGPPHGDTPAVAPPPRRPRRRLWVAAAGTVVLVAALVAGVLTLRGTDDPVVVAAGPVPALDEVFPAVSASGCVPGDPSDYRISGGATPLQVAQCSRGPFVTAYARWPSAANADLRVRAYQGSASTDGGPRVWQDPAGVIAGPYYQTVSATQCTSVAAYAGLSQYVQVYGPAERCADVRAIFDSLVLPDARTLRSAGRAFPAASGPGCAVGTPRPGASGVAPLDVSACTRGDGATVSYAHWSTPADAVDEANAARAGSGGPMAWTTPDGLRQGPYARTEEDDGTCRVVLGWDAAPYSATVLAPDCDVADRTVEALAPPPAATLPT